MSINIKKVHRYINIGFLILLGYQVFLEFTGRPYDRVFTFFLLMLGGANLMLQGGFKYFSNLFGGNIGKRSIFHIISTVFGTIMVAMAFMYISVTFNVYLTDSFITRFLLISALVMNAIEMSIK